MRKFTAQEINHLQKSGIDPFSVDMKKIGEMPVEYITSSAEFYSKVFKVNENVLIPRVESESIIDFAMEEVLSAKNQKNKILFADVATGSGALGISFGLELRKHNREFNAYLSDISESALEVCNTNVELLFMVRNKKSFAKQTEYNIVGNSKVKVFKSDLLTDYAKGVRLDIILANLPYIPTGRIESLQSSVKDFEPTLALDGGEQGVDLILKLLVQAYDLLKQSGTVILEVDDTHDEKMLNSSIFVEDREYWNISILKDLNEKTRYWICKKKTYAELKQF